LDIHCAVLDKGEPLVDGFQVSKYFSFGYSLRKLGLRETRGGSVSGYYEMKVSINLDRSHALYSTLSFEKY
jgi:hypothetical protein